MQSAGHERSYDSGENGVENEDVFVNCNENKGLLVETRGRVCNLRCFSSHLKDTAPFRNLSILEQTGEILETLADITEQVLHVGRKDL